MKIKKLPTFKNIFSVFLTAIIVLSLLQIYFANHLATEGDNLKKAEIDIQDLTLENTKMREEVVALGSLSRIRQEADKLGMVRVCCLVFVNSAEVASLR